MELPLFENIYKKYSERGFAAIAVEITGNDTGAGAYLAENSFSFTFVKGTREMFINDYNVYAAPVWYLIDRSGILVYRHIGYVDGDEKILEDKVAELLKE